MIPQTAPRERSFLCISILSLQPEWRDGLGSRKMVKIKLKIEFFVKGCKYCLLQSCTTIDGSVKRATLRVALLRSYFFISAFKAHG